jgi:hypothetical protein
LCDDYYVNTFSEAGSTWYGLAIKIGLWANALLGIIGITFIVGGLIGIIIVMLIWVKELANRSRS